MSATTILCPIALAAFVPFVIQMFAQVGPRRAVAISLLGGWMFLPVFDGWCAPPLLVKKEMFVPGIVFLVSVLVDFRSWSALRPRLIDVPVTLLVVGPFVTSLVNDIGPYDGAQASFQVFFAWAAPYLLGRAYFTSLEAVRYLAETVARAGIVYVPFCIWEIRMSPQLHRTLYGFHQQAFLQTWRFGGFRPVVFMGHGLMVALFMAAATLVLYWIWRTRAHKALFGIPVGWALMALATTTILTKSAGALALLALGVLVLEGTLRYRSSIFVLVLVAIPAAYCTARMAGWRPDSLISLTERINAERAESLAFRVRMEDLLVSKAMQRPILGWGRWGRSRVYDDEGDDISVTDGLWIIQLGVAGLVGLVAMGGLVALPLLAFARGVPVRYWGDRRVSPAAALAVAVGLWAIDSLPNAMVNPIYVVAAGAFAVHVGALGAARRGARGYAAASA